MTPGTRLGPYEILAPLGAGGMGEVYRARDTRLGRDVAIKVLPQHLSSSPEVRARFEREARAVSSLNHPHICTLHDVGREGDTDYLVMELVEGETLLDRLARGALPAADLLRFGTQIADALDRAHRAGIVHRDLKPGNVMLTKTGAKLMDFGLARATGMPGPGGASGVTVAALSPTAARPLTAEGAIVGAPVAFTQNEQLLASVSNEGTLVYREGSRGTFSSLAWFDRDGIGTQVIRDRELFQDMALSHDGKRLAFSVNSPGQGSTDLWIQDLVRGSASRLTFEEGGERYPVWSRDDRFLYYSSYLRNDGTIFRRTSDGTGSAEEVGATEQGFWPLAASSDGRWLVTGAMSAETDLDLLRFDLATKELTPLVATPFADDHPALSPDDHLLAYSSEQSGRWEVYVQALGGGSGKWQISTEGGLRPHWRADGRELFFLTRPDRLMSVEVEPGPVPRFSAPRKLFRHPMESFDVAPDGQRVVGLRPADGDAGKPLTVVTNWTQRIPN